MAREACIRQHGAECRRPPRPIAAQMDETIIDGFNRFVQSSRELELWKTEHEIQSGRANYAEGPA
jgi:hypothetical protein